MDDGLLKMDKSCEYLDIEVVNQRLISIKSNIYYSARDLKVLDLDKVDDSLETIIEQRISALELYKKSDSFLKLKKEYEKLLGIKRKLELKQQNRSQEILKILNSNQDIRNLSLKWLISTRAYNVLYRKEIYTLWDMIDYIVKGINEITENPDYWNFVPNKKYLLSCKRQDLLILESRQLWKNWIEEIEGLLQKYNINL